MGSLALLAAGHKSALYIRTLRPARYMSQCRLFDPQPVPKIGQAVFVSHQSMPMLVYNEFAVSRTSAPFLPEAYILETENNAKVLFVSRNTTIFAAKANTFVYLGGAGLALKNTLPTLYPLLHRKQRLVIVPCFSRKWNGEYPPNPAS